MLEQIIREITSDPYYSQNYTNDGERFVAWYLRRVLLQNPVEARQEITDGSDDKQIDAIVVDDDNRRVLVIQGKFITSGVVDAGPIREVLAAWIHLQDLDALQRTCNERLKERLEAVRQALEDDYEVEFELLTTGHLTSAADDELARFSEQLEVDIGFPAGLHVVDTEVIATRLAEAEARDLPVLTHEVALDPTKAMFIDMQGTRSVIASVSLRECLKLPGITDGRLFRKNVRQALGVGNKVNRGLRSTIIGERVRDFFFYHNGITAICRKFTVNDDHTRLKLEDLSVVNGCQSLTTIYSASQRIRALPDEEAQILFRFYEIPQRDLADRISIYTNSQSAVKPRDLRSNDRVMLSLKKAFETRYSDGFFVTQRGAQRPPDRDADKTVDCAELAKALMAWQCQRPNIAYNEKKLFDEYYRILFKADYDPVSIYALQSWINRVDKAWPNLGLNDALKAGKSYVRFHVLYAISSLIAYANKQGDKVPHPSATLEIAQQYAGDVLPLAVNCVNKAMESAITEAQTAGKVFSPQNWCKNRNSVQSEALVASTMIGMLPGIGAQAMIDKLKVPADQFGLRWSAE